jgi:hypothetical protein
MKQVILFLLFSLQLQAQTSYKNDDIVAAAGTEYEYLLTNIEYGLNDAAIQHLLGDMEYMRITEFKPLKNPNDYTIQYANQRNKSAVVSVHYLSKNIPGQNLPLTTKIEIFGDVNAVIKFYINFWSSQLNFEDIKVGEVVSTRFLSDVATLSFPDSKTAKITVVSSKDR